MRRVGLFGGTFDPPHLGHLAIAEWAREHLRLDRVIFMPAGTPPHKRRRDLSSAAARVAMSRLAVRGNRSFTVSTLEVNRRGPSFTVDTLLTLKSRYPGARLYLLIGEDSLNDFRTWHRPREIMRHSTLAVALRPGARRRSRSIARVQWLENPGLAISSSGIRARVRAGQSVRYLLNDSVARYVARHRLYRESR
jgi:nicotinate-nucleotide adenylyltransferase